MLPDKNKFLECVDTLLKSPNNASNMPVVEQMSALLTQVTGVSADDDIADYEDTVTESGIAISPVKAAKCLHEILRTQIFLKGVHQAIKDRLDSVGQVNVLYAGTGPFGSILIPLLPLFVDKKIKVYCIDIHQINIDAVSKVVSWLEVEDVVASIELADAIKWAPKSDIAFDIVISETMNTFLYREPQVRIFANLHQYLKPEGTLIPQEIETSVALKRHTPDGDTDFKHKLLVLNLESCRRIAIGDFQDFCHDVVMPTSDKFYDGMTLNTDIQVYDSHWLLAGDCSLNIAYNRNNLAIAPGQVARFEYKLTDDPFWQIDIPNLFESSEECSMEVKSETGLIYLNRFWDKYRRMAADTHNENLIKNEFYLDLKLTDLASLDLHTMMRKAIECKFDFAEFDAWITPHIEKLSSEDIQRFNEECMSYLNS